MAMADASPGPAWGTLGLVTCGAAVVAVVELLRQLHLYDKELAVAVAAKNTAAKEAEAARRLLSQERTGRISIERQVRKTAQKDQDANGYRMAVIGTVASCFPDRRGAPRQGLMAPSTRAIVEFKPCIAPAALDELSRFSHVWIFFVFHENTNLHMATGSLPPGKTYTAKIAPPVLGGKKVGVFATRTPHRPNPIGLSVVRLDSISTSPNAIHISGVDLVNGTPVIDIKPYVPSYDSVPDATSPEWTHQDPNANTRRRKVAFQPAAEHALQTLYSKSRYYDSCAALRGALAEVLHLDIRSVHQGRGTATGESRMYSLRFDGLVVDFATLEESIVVHSIVSL